MEKGFDTPKYLKLQYEKIQEKLAMFDHKLYLEFGGKLFDDYHASRVLPGFEPDAKLTIMQQLKEDLEIIFCINASDIEKNKVRADYGITYDMELLRLIEKFQQLGIVINSVVITLYTGQSSVEKLREILAKKHIPSYLHKPTKGYPTNVDLIVSDEGYGQNEYIPTTKKIVVVTAPGPNSGKLATCLSQLYHEYKRGIQSGYAKFETFPVWNLPLKHPINIAYEAATAELNDINMIDAFHLDAYGKSAVNYNRDLATFPILKNIITKITGKEVYKSPTDMGINVVKDCIMKEELVCEAAKQEIIRRFYKANCEYKLGNLEESVPNRIMVLMNELQLGIENRNVVKPALEKSQQEQVDAIALALPNGKIITGKRTKLLTPVSSVIINAIKELTRIEDEVYLLSPAVLEPIQKLKKKTLYNKYKTLNLQEVLIALSICSATNPIIVKAINNLEKLAQMEAHSSYLIDPNESQILKNIGIRITSEPAIGLTL